jgi:hypothetical protein
MGRSECSVGTDYKYSRGTWRSRAALKPFSQPTTQPTECDVLCDLRVV